MGIYIENEFIYEGSSISRLSYILGTILPIFAKVDNDKYVLLCYKLSEIRSELLWDNNGYEILYVPKTIETLKETRDMIRKSKGIIKLTELRVLCGVIEPLEIAITELELGYSE